MRAMKLAFAKLGAKHRWDDFVSAAPTMEQRPEALHNLIFPRSYQAVPEVHAQMSPLEETYLSRSITSSGEEVSPHPLQPLVDLAAAAASMPTNCHVSGILTATYPSVYREDLQRNVCARFPNGDAWFNVVTEGCAFGGTADGCGGEGDDVAWLAAHLALAVALQVMRAGLPGVTSIREAAHLLEDSVRQTHHHIMQVDQRGSAALLLHMCFHISDDKYVFVYACTGDAEVYWLDSKRGEWRYLIEPIGTVASTLRVNASQMPGAVGLAAANDSGQLRNDTNLQYGAVACCAADTFLMASDGLWDTLDVVQNGHPHQFGYPHENWQDLNASEIRRIVPLVPVIKQRRLTAVTKAAAATSPQQIVNAVVAHAVASTRGERQLFEIIDVDSKGASSIYHDSISQKGQQDSLYAESKAASEAAGQLIFAKPDHLGIQCFSPAAIPSTP